MADNTIKKYPDFVNKHSIKADVRTINESRFRFSLIIPFYNANSREFACVIMKNPSTANANRCDKTAYNVCLNVYNAGYGGVIILNLFPYMATNAKQVYKDYFTNEDLYADTMALNYAEIDMLCDKKDVVFAWGTNTIWKNKKFQAVYDEVIENVIDIVTTGCAKSATAPSIFGSDYPDHPRGVWSYKYYLRDVLEGEIVEESTRKKEFTPEDDEYWRSNVLERMMRPELDKKHPVIHHNMYGPRAYLTTAEEDPDTYMIYCRKEHAVCLPDCRDCEYFYDPEMGYGIACLWDDYPEGDERVIGPQDKYREYDRVDCDLNGPEDLMME